MRGRVGGGPCLAVCLLAGCATGSSAADIKEVRALADERLGSPVRWADEADVAATVDSLLVDPLDADRAVRIALVNNPGLLADFEGLGIARGDLIQGGLLPNPHVEGAIRYPHDGEGGSNPEAAVAYELLDVLLIPTRRRVASAALEQAKMRVGLAVLHLAGEVRTAFHAVQAARQLLELQRRIAAAAEVAAELGARQHAGGNLSALDLGELQAADHRARLDLAREEMGLQERREGLNRLLGLWGRRTTWTVAAGLPELPSEAVPLEGLESAAVAQRLDLAAAGKETEILARRIRLAGGTPYTRVEVGVESEREPGGGALTGPTASMELPLFDRGQGEVAGLMARWMRSRKRHEALAIQVRSEVRLARERVLRARRRTTHLHEAVLPLRRRMVEAAQRQYNFMLIGVYRLLRLRQEEYDAHREHIEALADYWRARAELDLAVGRRLSPAPQPGGGHHHGGTP